MGAGRNNTQYCAVGKAHRGGNRYGRGWEPGVHGTGIGKLTLPVTPQPLPSSLEFEIQRNLDLTKCQGTGPIGSLYRKPRYNEFVGKQPKCSLYRGIVNN